MWKFKKNYIKNVKKVKTLTIGSRIKLSFSVIIILLIVMFGSFSWNIIKVESQMRGINTFYSPVNRLSNSILSTMKDAQNIKERYRNTQFPGIYGKLESEFGDSIDTFTSETAKLKKLVQNDKEFMQSIVNVENSFNKFAETTRDIFTVYNDTTYTFQEHLLTTYSNSDLADDILTIAMSNMHSITQMTEDNSRRQNNNLLVIISRVRIITIILFIAGILFFVFTGVLLYHSISVPTRDLAETLADISEGEGDLTVELTVRRKDELGKIELSFNKFIHKIRSVVAEVQSAVVDVSTAIQQMSAATDTMSINIQQQAASSEEVSATTEEILAGSEGIAKQTVAQSDSLNKLVQKMDGLSLMMDNVSEEIKKAVNLTEDYSEKSGTGAGLLEEMNGSMKRVFDGSHEIEKIITIISEISEQINLLSLNASIEAARAGDHGKGFAVVADEISKLAEQTAASLKQIHDIIRSNNEEIHSGLSHVEQIIKLLSEIIEGFSSMRNMLDHLSRFVASQLNTRDDVLGTVQEVQQLSDQINSSSQEQKTALDEISRSIASINEISQTNAASSRQMSGVTQQIGELSDNLSSKVSFFKVAK